MSDQVITRVDNLIRHNNIKYKDEQDQKAYELALLQHQKISQKEMTKNYSSLVKNGNRKAIQKAKQSRNAQKKKKKKASRSAQHIQIKQDIMQRKPKKSEAEVEMFNQTVEARAERILHEQQLSKLNRKLQQQRKRTKLYQLNQKCKKMLSKSHERIVPARGVSVQKMNILKQMQERAFEQIDQLDNIINGIVDRANQNKNTVKNVKYRAIGTEAEREQNEEQKIYKNSYIPRQNNEGQEGYRIHEKQEGHKADGFDNLLNLNTLIFDKSTQELLRMNYIPI